LKATEAWGLQRHGDYRGMGATEAWGLQRHGGYRGMGTTEAWGLQRHGGVRGELPFPPNAAIIRGIVM